jgi:hypothetical protein
VKTYEAPQISLIGTVRDLTEVDKCGGSGDNFLPQLLSNNFSAPGTHCGV